MMANELIEKIKASGLTGRGGAGFLTGLKWETVKNAKGSKKFVICNASEGEPGTLKDGYILENYPERVVEGIALAMEALGSEQGYVFLRKDYYNKFKNRLEELIGDLPIKLWENEDGYLEGEETVLISCIEGGAKEPKKKPPFPTECGLFGCPTLINNTETFYAVSEIYRGEYDNQRFYSLSGDLGNPGVFKLKSDMTVAQILKETGNMPKKDAFFQIGSGISGEIILGSELDYPVEGAGVIVAYDLQNTDLNLLMEKWARFFMEENCDRCVPCREGIYRIWELLKNGLSEDEKLDDIFFALENSSFCPLGKSAPLPFRSLRDKIILKK